MAPTLCEWTGLGPHGSQRHGTAARRYGVSDVIPRSGSSRVGAWRGVALRKGRRLRGGGYNRVLDPVLMLSKSLNARIGYGGRT